MKRALLLLLLLLGCRYASAETFNFEYIYDSVNLKGAGHTDFTYGIYFPTNLSGYSGSMGAALDLNGSISYATTGLAVASYTNGVRTSSSAGTTVPARSLPYGTTRIGFWRTNPGGPNTTHWVHTITRTQKAGSLTQNNNTIFNAPAFTTYATGTPRNLTFNFNFENWCPDKSGKLTLYVDTHAVKEATLPIPTTYQGYVSGVVSHSGQFTTNPNSTYTWTYEIAGQGATIAGGVIGENITYLDSGSFQCPDYVPETPEELPEGPPQEEPGPDQRPQTDGNGGSGYKPPATPTPVPNKPTGPPFPSTGGGGGTGGDGTEGLTPEDIYNAVRAALNQAGDHDSVETVEMVGLATKITPTDERGKLDDIEGQVEGLMEAADQRADAKQSLWQEIAQLKPFMPTGLPKTSTISLGIHTFAGRSINLTLDLTRYGSAPNMMRRMFLFFLCVQYAIWMVNTFIWVNQD